MNELHVDEKNMSQDHLAFLHSLFQSNEESKRNIIKSIKAKADSKRSLAEKMADFMTSLFGSIVFLLMNVVVFIVWIIINTGQIAGIVPFDPFPFSLLTTFVSLEAIILAIFVLISQNRNSKVDDLREETDLQINFISEREITKLMKMVAIVLERQGVDLSKDPELRKLLKPLSEEEIEHKLEKEIF